MIDRNDKKLGELLVGLLTMLSSEHPMKKIAVETNSASTTFFMLVIMILLLLLLVVIVVSCFCL